MPNHRFILDLERLENEPLRENRTLLVIGTFNAEDQEGIYNDALWFYGRKGNEFWYLLPQMLGHQSLHQREHPNLTPFQLAERWREYSHINNIEIIDLYKFVGEALQNHGDASIENPEQYDFFDYQRAFQQVYFQNVLFTWKVRTNKHVLGRRKEEMHNWFSQRGSRILHMITPSYAYPKRKDIKLESWRQLYNAQ